MRIYTSLRILGLALIIEGVSQAAPISATAYSVSGTVEFQGPGGLGYSPLKKGQILDTGSTVRTGDDGKAVLQTTPGSAVALAPNSILKINELAFAKSGGTVTERKARLQLTTGAVSALIDPSTPTVTDFQIQTPQGAAAARGTGYTVVVYQGKTYVGVGHGKVAATSQLR